MIYNKTTMMESDSESPVVITVTIGNNIMDELVLCLEEEVYDDEAAPRMKTTAVIDKDNMSALAGSLKIKPEELKQHLIDRFEENGRLTKNYVCHVYQQILEYILDRGGKYRFKKK